MKLEGSLKQEHILDAAIRRFSYFGVNKTTLTEIAEDLGISKTLLFYYFPDKNNLIAAVAAKIIDEFVKDLEKVVESTSTVEEGFIGLVELKRAYFKKYFLLAIQGENIDIRKISSSLPQIYLEARGKNESLISRMLKKGVEEKLLRPMDVERASHLFMETLSAFEFCIRARKSVPEMKDIDELFDKQKEVVMMILNGLKSDSWKTNNQ
jgi:TetR/AcrR family transcriptional repressor of mexJK operon